MSDSVLHRGALAGGVGALIGLLAAKARAAFVAVGAPATAYEPASSAAGADGNGCFRYDDFARPESELRGADNACRHISRYSYDEVGSLSCVVEPMEYATQVRGDHG